MPSSPALGSTSFTLQVYGHLMEWQRQQAADMMDVVLKKSSIPVATVVATVGPTAKVN